MPFKSFNNQKLRNKFLIIYIVGFLIPIIAINSIFSYNIYKEQINFDKQFYEKTIENTQVIIQNKINSTLQVIYTVYVSKDLLNFLESDYASMSEYMKNREKAMSVIKHLRVRHDNYKIYTVNQTILSDPIISQITKDVEESEWFKDSRAREKTANLYYTRSNPEYLSIIRTLDFNQHKKKTWNNVIKADIPISQIQLQLDKIKLDYGISLLSDKGEVVVSNKRVNNNYKYLVVDFPDNSLLSGWKLEGRMPKSGFINSKLVRAKLHLFFPQLLIVVLGSIVIFILSSSFYKRIYTLSDKMKSVKDGQFNTVDISDKHLDEITKLSMSYNIMVDKIDSLINEVSDARLRERNIELVKNKAQLSALLSQINPHYLFNVLEAIRMKSVIKSEVETAKIIKHLSKSFRHILSWDQNLVSINEEVEIVKDFLIIQKYRFEDKLEYLIDVADDCQFLDIPKLTLQPFIENSCIHGIEKSSQNGKVVVKVYKDKTNLICKIEDNGIGIPEEQLHNLKQSLENFEISHSHIGFSNTYWRLKKMYSDFKLHVDSTEGKGTTVILSIPLNIKEQLNDKSTIS